MEDALSGEAIPSVDVLYNSERMPHTTLSNKVTLVELRTGITQALIQLVRQIDTVSFHFTAEGTTNSTLLQ